MILITGATGNVGRELVRVLIAAGEKVRALLHDPRKTSYLDEKAERFFGDLDKPQTLTNAFDGIRSVYLVSKADQVAPIIEIAKRKGVQHIVRQSTMEAGFDPPFGPGRWHRDAELTIERSGISFTHLRPTMMMVNTLSWWAPNIRAKRVVFFPAGTGLISPVDPRDIAAVAEVMLTKSGHEGHSYDVTGPELLSFSKMVAIISQAIGEDIDYTDVPEAAAAEQMVKLGMQEDLVEALIETIAGVRANKFAYIADTVPRLTGLKGTTWRAWCLKHANDFR